MAIISTSGANARPVPDPELTDIADYVDGYSIREQRAIDAARLERTPVHEFVAGLIIWIGPA